MQKQYTEVPLNEGFVAIVDQDDLPLITGRKWWPVKTKHTTYAATWIDGKNVQLHKIILPTGDGEEPDHVNGDGLDNRRSNLRPVTRSQNLMNQRMRDNNTSGFKGVSWHVQRGRWQSRIMFEKKSRYLGLYLNAEDAAHAYDDAARKFFGEFACVNFPREGERGARS